MAKKHSIDTADLGQYIQVNCSQDELNACLASHLDVLAANIRNPRPADGTLPMLVSAIEILKTKIVARDDKLGRGLGHPDAE